jgi:hypothetical protein
MQARRSLLAVCVAGTTGDPAAGRIASGIRQSRSATPVSAKVSLSEIASASPTPMLKLPKSFGRRPVIAVSVFSIAAASSVGSSSGRDLGSSVMPSRSPGANRSAIADAAARSEASAPRKTLVSSMAR